MNVGLVGLEGARERPGVRLYAVGLEETDCTGKEYQNVRLRGKGRRVHAMTQDATLGFASIPPVYVWNEQRTRMEWRTAEYDCQMQ